MIENRVFGLGQTNEQVDAHDETRGQRTFGHDLDEEDGSGGEQIDRVEEARAVGCVLACFDFEKFHQDFVFCLL